MPHRPNDLFFTGPRPNNRHTPSGHGRELGERDVISDCHRMSQSEWLKGQQSKFANLVIARRPSPTHHPPQLRPSESSPCQVKGQAKAVPNESIVRSKKTPRIPPNVAVAAPPQKLRLSVAAARQSLRLSMAAAPQSLRLSLAAAPQRLSRSRTPTWASSRSSRSTLQHGLLPAAWCVLLRQFSLLDFDPEWGNRHVEKAYLARKSHHPVASTWKGPTPLGYKRRQEVQRMIRRIQYLPKSQTRRGGTRRRRPAPSTSTASTG